MLAVTAALLALAVPTAQAAECAEAATPAQLRDTLKAAEAAWKKADEDGFLLKMEEAVLQLPCVAAPLEPALAARYHRDLGLWLFASQQRERAEDAFAAARRIDPQAPLPEALVPAGHPVRKLFDGSKPDATTAPVPVPAAGQALFDGSPGERPTATNTIFQIEADGATSITTYLLPDTALPSYEEYVPPPQTGLQGWHLAVGAGALAAASGGLLFAARSTQDSFLNDTPAKLEDLDAMYARNRAFSTTSAVLAGTAGALGVVAVFTW